MTAHQLSATCQRTVDAELTLDEEGKIDEEEIVNVGSPSAFDEEYNCECGEYFETFKEAKNHILDERAKS